MKAHGIDFTERFVEPRKWNKKILEILNQKWKSNTKKLQELFEYEKEHNWLVDIKLDAWLWLNNKNTSWKTIEQIKEEYAWELLEMSLAKELWKYEEIKEL